MALKIRLRQQGRNNRPFYRVVVTDCRSPRDGKYLEAVGWYNPFEVEMERHLSLQTDRIQHWLGLGAQLTDSVGVLLHKVAPEVTKSQTAKLLSRRAKITAKRRQRRRAAAVAAA